MKLDWLKNLSVSSAEPPPVSKVDGIRSDSVASDSSRPYPAELPDNVIEDLTAFTKEYQLTVRAKVHLSRKARRLLLDVLLYQAIHSGISFLMYLTVDYLLESLMFGKEDWMEVKDSNERRVCGLAYEVLGQLRDSNLDYDNSVMINEKTRQEIIRRGLVMNKRTYGSRFSHYRPERYLELRAVELETIYERSKIPTKRYSGYSKGHGESHPSAHTQRTKPSAELDGEDTDRIPEISLGDLIDLLYLNVLELERIGLKNQS